MTQTSHQPPSPDGTASEADDRQPAGPFTSKVSGSSGYQPSPYGVPAPWQSFMAPAPPIQNGFGVTGLVLGIVGLVFVWIPALNLALGIIATTFGALGWGRFRRRQATNGGQALAGMIMGIITVVGAIIVTILIGLSGSS